MKREWKEYRLEDIATVQTGPFGSQLHMSDYKTNGTPIITVEHLGENKIIHENLPLVGAEDKERLKKYILKEGDIVFSRVGSVDRSAYVSAKENGWMFSGRCLRVRTNDKVDSKFISYYFNNENFREHIRMIAVGATMPSINTTILSEVGISIPPISEQKQIAEVLSSLDDKIDLLQHQNKILEQLAETIFRQRFVEEADESWEITSLGQHTEVFRGLSYKGSGLTEKSLGLPMHNLNSVYEGGGYKHEGIKFYMGDYKERHLVNGGDIIVTNTEQGHEFRLIGFPAIVPDDLGQKGLFSQHIYKLVPLKESYLSREFIYYLLMTSSIREQIIGATNGSTVNMLAIDGLQRPEFKLPPKEKITGFSNIIRDYWKKKGVNQNQIHCLTQLRLILLPKLISGK